METGKRYLLGKRKIESKERYKKNNYWIIWEVSLSKGQKLHILKSYSSMFIRYEKIYTGCQFNIASLKCRESRRAAVEFDSKHKTQVISYEGHV